MMKKKWLVEFLRKHTCIDKKKSEWVAKQIIDVMTNDTTIKKGSIDYWLKRFNKDKCYGGLAKYGGEKKLRKALEDLHIIDMSQAVALYKMEGIAPFRYALGCGDKTMELLEELFVYVITKRNRCWTKTK